MKPFLFFIIIFSLGASCSKNKSDEDKVLPVVTLTNPVNGHVYNAGEAITITGNITDDKFIAEAHIHVTNTGTGALLMDVHIYPNGTSATFNQSLTAVAGVSYRIQVIARDRAVNETRATVDVSCN